jgi:uncharacterized Tic20 family protein
MVVQSPAPPLQEPQISQDDRVLAALSHASMFVGFPILAPIAIYFYKRETSRFVAFHAMQAALLHISFIPLMILGYVAALILSIGSAMTVHINAEITGLLLGVVWVVALCVPIGLIVIVSLYAAYRAYLGHAYRIPIIWRIAKSFLDAPTPAAPPPI